MKYICYNIEDMERVRSYVTGMLLSFISWEAWQNIVISIVVALIGGFAAAAGRQVHQRVYEWRQKRIKEHEQQSKTDQ